MNGRVSFAGIVLVVLIALLPLVILALKLEDQYLTSRTDTHGRALVEALAGPVKQDLMIAPT